MLLLTLNQESLSDPKIIRKGRGKLETEAQKEKERKKEKKGPRVDKAAKPEQKEYPFRRDQGMTFKAENMPYGKTHMIQKIGQK